MFFLIPTLCFFQRWHHWDLISYHIRLSHHAASSAAGSLRITSWSPGNGRTSSVSTSGRWQWLGRTFVVWMTQAPRSLVVWPSRRQCLCLIGMLGLPSWRWKMVETVDVSKVFQLVFRDQKVYTSGWPIFGLLATAAETVQCLSCKWTFRSSDCWFITCNYISLMSSTIFMHFLGFVSLRLNPSFWGAMPSNTTEAQLFHRHQGQCSCELERCIASLISWKVLKECYHLVRCVQSWTTWCWPHWYMSYLFAWWYLKVFWIVYGILTITVL